jgi:hypothetical protein
MGLIWTTRSLQKNGESHQKEPCNTGSSPEGYLSLSQQEPAVLANQPRELAVLAYHDRKF